MKINNELYWPCGEPGRFLQGSMVDFYENKNKNWMDMEEPRYNAKEARLVVFHLWGCTSSLKDLQYSQCLVLLFFLIEKYPEHAGTLAYAMKIPFAYGDFEISRELALRTLKNSSKSDLKNSGKEYIDLIAEDKNTHVLDILGMIIDELSREKMLTEEVYASLLEDFSEPVKNWREYEVPKCKQKGCYETIKIIQDLCFRYEAYETCLRLSGLLFIAGNELQEYFAETVAFMGKVAYENGYEEIARQCFSFVESQSADIFANVEEKYRVILNKKTEMIIPKIAYDTDMNIQEKVESGEIRLYTKEEVFEYIANEKPKALKQQKKEQKQREKKLESVKARYDLIADTLQEETLKEINTLLEMLGEEDAYCAIAGKLYRQKGEIYLNLNELQKAEECLTKAYQCEEGRFSPELMKDFAVLAEKSGKKKEAEAYSFRASILS